MGLCETLTIVFVILKLIGTIEWTWFVVLLPEIIAFMLYLAMITITIVQKIQIKKAFMKKFN